MKDAADITVEEIEKSNALVQTGGGDIIVLPVKHPPIGLMLELREWMRGVRK
jgi:hypothetical protein